jgi:hypothetical protein
MKHPFSWRLGVLASWRFDFIFVAIAVLAAVDCGKSTAPSASVPSATESGEVPSAATLLGDAGMPMDPIEADLWARAREGDADDLMRLADRLGCGTLEERAQASADLRITTIRAMAFCRDFAELPWLANVAASENDEEAAASLEAAIDLSARPGRATDSDDVEELKEGCDALLSLAKATDKPRTRRVGAVRALRMLVDRGCVKREDIPTDVDAK